MRGSGNISTHWRLKDKALSFIREKLVVGDMKPGGIYSVKSIAEELGVSTGPVREAMLTLVEKKIMEVMPNRGFRVILLSDRDFNEIQELRLMIEVPAMMQLARIGLGVNETESRSLVMECFEAAENDDVTSFLTTDHDFHIFLLSILENKRLLQFIEQLREQSRLYALQHLSQAEHLHRAAKDHFELHDRLVARDVAHVEYLMTRHLQFKPGLLD